MRVTKRCVSSEKPLPLIAALAYCIDSDPAEPGDCFYDPATQLSYFLGRRDFSRSRSFQMQC